VETLRIVQADLDDPQHRAAILEMTRSYARDPMGNGRDLPGEIQEVLIERLRAHPTTLVFLALDRDQPIGIATCFIGFSTFAARPLVNVHDLHVAKAYQGRGVGRGLLDTVEKKARELDCCKLTLEVQENNARALELYARCGFASGQHVAQAGGFLFREKRL
jgi:GNAT superfamily N-acetyltransferase